MNLSNHSSSHEVGGGKEVGRIWEKLGEGKECNGNIWKSFKIHFQGFIVVIIKCNFVRGIWKKNNNKNKAKLRLCVSISMTQCCISVGSHFHDDYYIFSRAINLHESSVTEISTIFQLSAYTCFSLIVILVSPTPIYNIYLRAVWFLFFLHLQASGRWPVHV